MKLHTLLQKLQPYLQYNDVDNIEIQSIENDNRKVEEGSLFVCIKGYTVDGHDFAASAVEKGAVAVISEKELSLKVPVIVVKSTRRALSLLSDAFYGQPSQQLHLIGVTGTNGKTTTTHIIDKILSDAGQKTGLMGTMYTKIGQQKYEIKNNA